MTFNQYVHQFRQVAEIFKEIVSTGAMSLEPIDGEGVVIVSRPQRVSGFTKEMLLRTTKLVNRVEMLIFGSLLCEGPKVFRPRQVDLEVLEHTDINVCIDDYAQPFQTLVIEMPERYLQSKVIESAHGDGDHNPTLVLIHWRPDMRVILTCVTFSSGVSIKTIFHPSGNQELETYITRFTSVDAFNGCLPTSNDEWIVTRDVIRAAMNYCLLIDEVGCKRVGADNRSHEERLRRRAKKGDVKSRAELRSLPILYELNQEVKLYRSVRNERELNDGDSIVKSPHHRRGHYRMQPCGPQNSLKKRIRIAPVFVRKDLFLGDMANARASYT